MPRSPKSKRKSGLTNRQAQQLLLDIEQVIERKGVNLFVDLFNTGIVIDLKGTALQMIRKSLKELEKKRG